jgi:hypothetical protein
MMAIDNWVFIKGIFSIGSYAMERS